MAMNFWGILRTLGLWVLIIATSASVTIDFFIGNAVWAWFKLWIATGGVIAFEIYYYKRYGITISTKQKLTMIKHRFWGSMSLALFGIGLGGLILHLAVW